MRMKRAATVASLLILVGVVGLWVRPARPAVTHPSAVTLNTSGNVILPATTTVTIPALTAGSVLFAGTGGLISQDNANLKWDDATNQLTVGGTVNAGAAADVKGLSATFTQAGTGDFFGIWGQVNAAVGLTDLIGTVGYVQLSNGVTVANAMGTRGEVRTSHASAVITNAYGLWGSVGIVGDAGTITTAYSAYLDKPAIGTTRYALWASGLSVFDDTFSSGSGNYTHVTVQSTASVGTSGDYAGLFVPVIYSGTGTLAQMFSARSSLRNTSSGTVTTAIGVQATLANEGSGPVNLAAGVRASLSNSGTGTITDLYGFTLSAPTNNATVTTMYGFYAPALVGTTKWAFYANTDASRFNDIYNAGVYTGSTASTAPTIQSASQPTAYIKNSTTPNDHARLDLRTGDNTITGQILGLTGQEIELRTGDGLIVFRGLSGSQNAWVTRNMLVTNSGHIKVAGLAPSVSACGTSPSRVGGDTAGKVTVGTSPGGSCTVTFGTAYSNAPACIANNETSGNLLRATSTTTAITLTGTLTASDVLTYVCVGRTAAL